MKDALSSFIARILKDLGVPNPGVEVSVPEDAAHGDYTTNVAMTLAKQLKKSPMEIALQVVEKLKDQISKLKADSPDQNTDKPSHSVSPLLPLSPILSAIDRVEVAPPGFINVFLTEASLINQMQRLLKSAEAVKTGSAKGCTRRYVPKRIMVEFAHPNTHKAFHIGHLRNITTGESVIRLLESQGHEVIRANYQGDVGMHIAKALYALLHISKFKTQISKLKTQSIQEKVEFLGNAYAAGSKVFDEDPAAKDEIVSLNALIYAAAQRLATEKGIDPGTTDYLALVKDEYKDRLETVYKLWKETRQWSLDYFETIYTRVGSRYDRYYFESECLAGVDLSHDAVKRGVLKEDAGAIIFDGKPYSLDTRVFVNSLGLPTYEGKELALATMETTEHGKLDTMIHVVGPEQASFFKITFKAEELLGIVKPNVQHHLIYGWVKLKHGKMSSRSGNVVLGEWLLDEAKKAIYAILDKSDTKDATFVSSPRRRGSSLHASSLASLDSSAPSDSSTDSIQQYSPSDKELIAERAAVAAVKYAFLKVGTTSEIAFDIAESVNFQGDSGPYLQYTYARCKSVLRKAKGFVIGDLGSIGDVTLNPEERAVARLLTHFPDVVAEAADNFSPSTLCTYLFRLAQSFNLFYAKHSILPSSFRLSLTAATAQVLASGLYLLGIEVLEQM